MRTLSALPVIYRGGGGGGGGIYQSRRIASQRASDVEFDISLAISLNNTIQHTVKFTYIWRTDTVCRPLADI